MVILQIRMKSTTQSEICGDAWINFKYNIVSNVWEDKNKKEDNPSFPSSYIHYLS